MPPGPQGRAASAQEFGEPVELRFSGADEILVEDNVRRAAAQQIDREGVLETPAQDVSRHGVTFRRGDGLNERSLRHEVLRSQVVLLEDYLELVKPTQSDGGVRGGDGVA